MLQPESVSPTDSSGPETGRLLRLAGATLGTCAFFLLFIGTLHATGALPEFLGGLDTFTGTMIFVAVWASAWASLRRATPLLAAALAGQGPVPVGWLTLAGTLTGMASAVAVIVAIALAEIADAFPEIVVFLLVAVAFGAAVGGVLGTLLGLAAAGLAKALIAVARRFDA